VSRSHEQVNTTLSVIQCRPPITLNGTIVVQTPVATIVHTWSRFLIIYGISGLGKSISNLCSQQGNFSIAVQLHMGSDK